MLAVLREKTHSLSVQGNSLVFAAYYVNVSVSGGFQEFGLLQRVFCFVKWVFNQQSLSTSAAPRLAPFDETGWCTFLKSNCRDKQIAGAIRSIWLPTFQHCENFIEIRIT